MRSLSLFVFFFIVALSLSRASQADRLAAPVYANHVVIYLDAALYKVIGESSMLKTEFSNVESKTTVRDGGKWSYTGTYSYGKDTYIEFLPGDPQLEKDNPPGEVDFGMSVDDRQDLPRLAKVLEAATHVPCPVSVQRVFLNDRDIVWYDSLSASLAPRLYDTTSFWVMAVYPEYLKQRYPDLKPEEEGTTREKYLARRYKPELLFRGVTAVKAGVEPEQLPLLVEQLSAFGYSIENKGLTTVAKGPAMTFEFNIIGADARRTVEVTLALNGNKTGQQTYSFGQGSTLTFHSDRTATWSFPGAEKFDQRCTTEAGRNSLPENLRSLCPAGHR